MEWSRAAREALNKAKPLTRPSATLCSEDRVGGGAVERHKYNVLALLRRVVRCIENLADPSYLHEARYACVRAHLRSRRSAAGGGFPPRFRGARALDWGASRVANLVSCSI